MLFLDFEISFSLAIFVMYVYEFLRVMYGYNTS